MTSKEEEALISLAAELGQRFALFGETFVKASGRPHQELAYPILVEHEYGPSTAMYVMRDERLALVVVEVLNLFPKLVEKVIELDTRARGILDRLGEAAKKEEG